MVRLETVGLVRVSLTHMLVKRAWWVRYIECHTKLNLEDLYRVLSAHKKAIGSINDNHQSISHILQSISVSSLQ